MNIDFSKCPCITSQNIDVSQMIRLTHEMEKTGPVFISQPVLKEKTVPFFPLEESTCYPTFLRFPPKAAGAKEKQVQQLNYDNLIHVMAEIIQKYAPEILE